jgi:serine-type D-Ala-D-Ala carboxypeptidase/endopeptidase
VEALERAVRQGLAAAVGGEVLTLGTTGRTVDGRPEPVTAATPFAWASITKTVTGTLLACLSLDGTVRLDQPLSSLLPGAPELTLESLATHTSGLPRLLPSTRKALSRVDRDDPYAEEDAATVLEALRHTRLRKQKYRYSNAGAGLLGLGLARAAGTSYDDLVQVHVARPLGLTRLTGAVADDLAVPHDRKGRPVRPWRFAEGAQGAGTLAGTVVELDRWLRAAEGDAPEPLAAALRLATAPRAKGAFGGRVGLGWHVGLPMSKRSADLLWHNGALAGTASFAGVQAGRRVALLANSEGSLDRLGESLLRPG